ncbi:S8 family serine peptidase [Streptomyces sp. NPDC006879]|uniref:S8 family peptidase n=1 Tax=Streptomyces sp. NPDC006879 TaxID=3364767 RepID=UPI003688C38F
MTTPSAAAPTTTSMGTKAGPDLGPPRSTTRIALITGDRVLVDAEGRPVGMERAKGREHVPVSVQRVNGHFRVVPFDAQRLVSTGVLDARLFDITELNRPEYRSARRQGMRLIVGYRGAAPTVKRELERGRGTEIRRSFASLNAQAVQAPAKGAAGVWEALTDVQRTANGAGQRVFAPGVARVWLDAVRRASLDKSTRQIGADAAWRSGYDGTGVKIAVLDTGVDGAHPDLSGQVVAQRNFSAAPDAGDRFGHGTHVASIAAGTGAASGGAFKGVAPGARLLSGKVLDDNGFGDDSGIIAGMEWAVDQGADIVNLSLGGADAPGEDPLEEAVNRLSARGVLFAVAAGNSGAFGSGTVGSPGSADAALTVGAVDDADALAPFSSTGPRVGDGAVKPDLTAPGVDITAAAAPGSVIEQEVGQNPQGYLSISGTSMATPHAAGAAALLKQEHPRWKGKELKGALIASTKPGRYSPFQQGSGRIAVDRALHQSVIAEPVSLAFGVQQWPHGDDVPVTKKVSLRNVGSKAVTFRLKLTATGPGGRPAPKGFFTLSAPAVTVPAGGRASVGLRADTRLGGSANGVYSAYLEARGGGQRVRVAAAVEREVESYDLTLRHLGRDGEASGNYSTSLNGVSGPARNLSYDPYDESGRVTLRIPKGDYVLATTVFTGLPGAEQGADWLVQPRLRITGDTSLTLDARKARPVRVTLPSPTATTEFAAPGFTLRSGDSTYGYGWWLDSYRGFRTKHLGPAVTGGNLTQQWDVHGTNGPLREYHAVFGGTVQRLATGYTKRLRMSEFATMKARQGVSVPGKEGYLRATGWLPKVDSAASISFPRRLPTTTTLYLSAGDGVRWDIDFEQTGGRDADGFPVSEAMYSAAPRQALKPGRTYRETFNTGVFGPRLNGELGLFRSRDTLSGYLPLFADGEQHVGASLHTSVATTLSRNGAVIARSTDALAGDSNFEVPAGDALYSLATKVVRSPALARTSTRLEARWTFRSKRTAGTTRLPDSVVRFSPKLAWDSTSPAGRTVRVPVTVQGAAAEASRLRSLSVYVSYDDGQSWHRLKVRAGAVEVRNPAKGKAVSLRGKVIDKQGNKSDLKIIRAYFAG